MARRLCHDDLQRGPNLPRLQMSGQSGTVAAPEDDVDVRRRCAMPDAELRRGAEGVFDAIEPEVLGQAGQPGPVVYGAPSGGFTPGS